MTDINHPYSHDFMKHYREPHHYLSQKSMSEHLSCHNRILMPEGKLLSGSDTSNQKTLLYTTVANPACGEATQVAITIPHGQKHELTDGCGFRFSEHQCAISLVSGSLLALFVQELTDQEVHAMAQVTKEILKNKALRRVDEKDIHRVFGCIGNHRRRADLINFVSSAKEFPTRRSCYWLNILAFFCCLTGVKP
ncbi:MAG: hypothetical protein OXC40_05340 [Proteobacteria bacterium]|nr:hypothetical protein [Pseudomonadota bacterium]